MKNLKHTLIILMTFLLVVPLSINAQDEEKKKKSRPVAETFNSSLMLDRQTVNGPREKGLELIIHHRFGKIEELDDLFGLYAPSNIRLGLDYGITDKLMLGVGLEKNNKLLEFHGKYAILQQTRKNEMPVSLSYYVNMAIDTRNKEVFGTNYTFTNTLSYFHQLIIARKFGDKLSVLVTPQYAHFNAVDSVWQNDQMGVGVALKYNAFGAFSIIAEYDQPMSVGTVRYFQTSPMPNLGLGFEIATGTHCFQLFAANYDKITPQKNLAFNQNGLADGEFRIGMNVLVRF